MKVFIISLLAVWFCYLAVQVSSKPVFPLDQFSVSEMEISEGDYVVEAFHNLSFEEAEEKLENLKQEDVESLEFEGKLTTDGGHIKIHIHKK